MRAFIVELENRPGKLAECLAGIAERGVNLTTVGGAASGDRGAVALIAEDESGLRGALDAAGIGCQEVDLVTVSLQDRPGSLADAARRLGEAGVNVSALVPTGMGDGRVSIAIGVDDADAARRALAELAESVAR